MTLPELAVHLRDHYRVEYRTLEDEVMNEQGKLPTRYFRRTTDTGQPRTATVPAMSPEDPVDWIIIERICARLDIPYREAFATVDGFPHAD